MSQVRLTDEQQAQLLDLASFVSYSIKTGKYDFATVLRTIDHDALGLAHQDPTFLPKTSGYAKTLADLDGSVAS